jgi:hypothetical protein
MVGMLKDQPFNQAWCEEVDKAMRRSSNPIEPIKSENVGLQDGMLAYYLSQAPLTEEHESGIMAREYFNLRDMLEPKK